MAGSPVYRYNTGLYNTGAVFVNETRKFDACTCTVPVMLGAKFISGVNQPKTGSVIKIAFKNVPQTNIF